MNTLFKIALTLLIVCNTITLQAQNLPVDSIAITNSEFTLKIVKFKNKGYSFIDEGRVGKLCATKENFYCDEIPVSNILAQLLNTYTKRIIDSSKFDYLLKIDFNCLDSHCLTNNQKLIDQIEAYCSFTVNEIELNTEVWNLSVVDSVKLNNYKSLKSDKKERSYIGNEFKTTFENSSGIIIYNGSNIAGLVDVLNYNIKSEIVNTTQNSWNYNFGTIKFKSIKDLKHKLEKRYGLALNKSNRKIRYFKIEPSEL